MATRIIKDPRDPSSIFLVSDEVVDHIRGGHADQKTATGSFFNEGSDVLEMLRTAVRAAPHPTEDNRAMTVAFERPIGYDATRQLKQEDQEDIGVLMKFQSNRDGANPGYMSLVLAPAVASSNFGEQFGHQNGSTSKLTAIAGATDFRFVDEETAALPEVQAAHANKKCFSFLTAYPGEPCPKIADMDLLAGDQVFMAKPKNPSFIDLKMVRAVASDFIKKFNAVSLQGNLNQEKASPDALRAMVEKAAQQYRDQPRHVVAICERSALLSEFYSWDTESSDLGNEVADVPDTPFRQHRFDFNDNTSVFLSPEFEPKGEIVHYSLSNSDYVELPHFPGNLSESDIPDFYPKLGSDLNAHAAALAQEMLSSYDTKRFCPQTKDATDLGRRIAQAIAAYPATDPNAPSLRLDSLPGPLASGAGPQVTPAPAIDIRKLRGHSQAVAPSDKLGPKI